MTKWETTLSLFNHHVLYVFTSRSIQLHEANGKEDRKLTAMAAQALILPTT